MSTFEHLGDTGNSHFLIDYLGNPETTIVCSERYLMAAVDTPLSQRRIPDMLVAFNVDRALFLARNAYVIADQGKPPDFVLEIASSSNPERDIIDKREAYAAMSIPEYWRFDKTGQHHGTRLAADILVNGTYQPMNIEEIGPDTLQGYSPALGLNIRWQRQQLLWYDPATDRPIPSFQSERDRAERAEAEVRRLQERLRQYEG